MSGIDVESVEFDEKINGMVDVLLMGLSTPIAELGGAAVTINHHGAARELIRAVIVGVIKGAIQELAKNNRITDTEETRNEVDILRDG